MLPSISSFFCFFFFFFFFGGTRRAAFWGDVISIVCILVVVIAPRPPGRQYTPQTVTPLVLRFEEHQHASGSRFVHICMLQSNPKYSQVISIPAVLFCTLNSKFTSNGNFFGIVFVRIKRNSAVPPSPATHVCSLYANYKAFLFCTVQEGKTEK